MANTRSALKAARQSEKRRARNRGIRTRVRSASKAALAASQAPDAGAAEAAVRLAQSVIDRAARKGVLHRRAADRRKSRLMRRIRAASGGA